jgi:transglutaminase-like putative cysteine protease
MFPELRLREGWVTVFCLLLMVLCVAWAIQAADWADGLSILQGTVLVGGVSGIVLAKSRVPRRLAHLLSLLAGWTWAIFLTTQVLAWALDLRGAAAVAELQARFHALFLIPFVEGASADNIVFVLLLAFLMWVMAYFCAWAVFRWQRVWWAVIVCGVALLLNDTYSSEPLTIYLILFLLFALLMVVRASLAFYEQQWRQANVSYSPELISVFLRAGLTISVGVILLAWLAPVALASRPLQPVWDKIGEPWRRFQEESTRIFRDLNYQNEPPLVSLGDRRMWFGGEVNLSDTPVAEVRARSGRYWRVIVFHEYLGNGWMSSDPDIVEIDENEQDLAFPELDLRFEMTQTVTVLRDWGIGDSLIAAAQPLRAGIPLRASVTKATYEEDVASARDALESPLAPGDGAESPLAPSDVAESLPASADAVVLPPAPGDPSALYALQDLPPGASYQVLSSLTKADEESLRQAGTEYPDWVTPRYLQLPESLPERIGQRAERIVEDYETPYDKALAIEAYLRAITYDEQIEGPGLGQDGVDYFLFESRAGYCDYYASSMVVMLRSVGVPARYVRGYSRGQAEDGIYRLLESDGHAWPEVYFPGYGWIEFEPTGGEPRLVRPSSQEAAEANQAAGREALRPPFEPDERLAEEEDLRALGPMPDLGQGPFWQRIGPWGWLVVGLLILGMVASLTLVVRRRRRVEGLSAIERVYEDLVNWVRRLLRIEPLAHQTPLEYAGIVSQQVPRGRQAVEQIAGLYVEERFSGKGIPDAPAEAAWREAWPALWRRWLGRRLDRLQHFLRRFTPPGESLEH